MKEIFSQAIQKMKRKDFLDDIVREKTSEASSITAEVSVLRKKNGARTGTELDLKIFQANAKKAEIEKLISKCKAEIKTLKAEILELLTDCYAKTDKPELIAKIESAAYHAFDGKIKLLSDKEAGGLWGDCEIIGAVITHDKKKKNTTASLVKAGAVNSTGLLLKRPKIYVYDYDKKQEEGILRPENDGFKARIKEKKQSKTLQYIKDTYFNVNLYYALGFSVLYAVFAIWAAVAGFASSIYGGLQIRYPIAIGAILGIFTLATLKTAKRGGIADFLPLVALDVSIVSFGCAFGYSNLLRAMFFPAVLFVYGLIAVYLRAKYGEESQKRTGLLYLVPVVLGTITAFIFRKMTSAPMAYWITAISVFGAIFVLSAVLSVVKRGTDFGNRCSLLSFAGCAFCIVCLLLVPNALVSALFIPAIILTGLAPVLAKSLK